MNKPYFSEKHFFIFTLFFILITSTHSSVQSNTEQLPQTVETPIAKTTATPHRIPGNMRFRHEMAELLGEKVGPDDSGDVYTAGGLAGYYTGQRNSFQERESSGNSTDFYL